jgi:hypothetical protein
MRGRDFMVGQEVTTASFIKNVFYKSCFCLGLGTAAVYSYGQVQEWRSPSAPISVQALAHTQDLSGKLAQIAEIQDGGAVPAIRGIRRRFLPSFLAPAAPISPAPVAVNAVPVQALDPNSSTVLPDGRVVKTESVMAVPAVAPVAPLLPPVPGSPEAAALAAAVATATANGVAIPVDPNAPAVANSSASPSPSPGSSPAEGDAQAQAQVQVPLDANGQPMQMPMDANGNPANLPFVFQAPNQNSDEASRTISSDVNAAAVPAPTSAQNLNGPGLPVASSNTAPSTSSSEGGNPTNGPAPSRTSSAGSSASTVSTSDLQLLTASSLRGSFTAINRVVTGSNSQGGSSSLTVSSVSWGGSDVLTDGSLTFNGSSSSLIQAVLTLNVQTSGSTHAVSYQLTSTAPHESTDATGKKTFSISFTDQSGTLSSVSATIQFDATGNIVSADSIINFSKADVQVTSITDGSSSTANMAYSMTLSR